MMAEIERKYKCQFCGKEFARKSWFDKHNCPKKKRFEEKNDIVVQKGFRLYVYWMRGLNLIGKSKEPNIDSFLKSPLKNSFIKLAIFTYEQNIPSAYEYVDWIIHEGLKERYWFSDDPEQLDRFKRFVNLHEDPADQAWSSYRSIEKWIKEKEERTVKDFFEMLTPGRVLSLVQQRKLRPWVIFTYNPIAEKWLDDDTYDPEVFYRIHDLVNCSYWADKVIEQPEGAETVKQIMDQIWSISQT